MSEFLYDAVWRSPVYLWVNYPKTMFGIVAITLVLFLAFNWVKK